MSPGMLGATHFQGVQGLAGLVSTLEEANGEFAISRRLYLLSRKMAATEALAAAVRIGGRKLALLGVRCRFRRGPFAARKDNASLNLAVLRRMVLKIVRSNRKKRLRSRRHQTRWLDQWLPCKPPRPNVIAPCTRLTFVDVKSTHCSLFSRTRCLARIGATLEPVFMYFYRLARSGGGLKGFDEVLFVQTEVCTPSEELPA